MDRLNKEALDKRILRLERRLEAYRGKLIQARQEIKALNKTVREQNLIIKEFPGWLILIQDRKIVLANEKVFEDLGYEKQEVLDHPFEQFVHQDSLEYVTRIHRKRLKGKPVPNTYDLNLISKSGNRVPCEARIGRIRYRRRNAFLVGLTPIEKRKDSEQRALSEEKYRIISCFSQGLVRELEGSTNLIKKCLDQAMSPGLAQKDLLSELHRVNAHQDDLVRVLKVLHEDDGTKKQIVGIPMLIEEALEDAKKDSAIADGPDTSVDVKIFQRASSMVMANATELRAAIAHVITNAIEASLPNGKVLVTLEETPGLAHIYVQDSGPGICVDDHTRIFDPFFSTKSDHLGLGLTIAWAVLKRHGGQIELSSRHGHGAFFSLSIPSAKVKPRKKLPPPGKALKHRLVMLLGQGDPVIEIVSEVLTNKGAVIIAPVSLEKAARLLEKQRIDIVIAELIRPDPHVLAFIKNVAERWPKLPIVGLTTHGEHSRRNKATSALEGSQNIVLIPLPVNMAHLLHIITRQLILGQF